jgi:hypothetical protein
MEIQKQQILDFFSYENDIFNPTESKHIRLLIKKSGVVLDDLFIDNKFQKVIFLLLEKNVFSPSNITEEQIEFAEILKITPSNAIIFEQLNQYLIFYMGYVQILLKGGISNNILISTELEISRKKLPVYIKVKDEVEVHYSFKKTKELNLIKLTKLLKLEVESDFNEIKSEIDIKHFKPFIKYNENIHYAFENNKITEKKINFLGSLLELKKFIELLIENKMIFDNMTSNTTISKLFIVRGKEINAKQLTKPNGINKRVKLLEYIILMSKNSNVYK